MIIISEYSNSSVLSPSSIYYKQISVSSPRYLHLGGGLIENFTIDASDNVFLLMDIANSEFSFCSTQVNFNQKSGSDITIPYLISSCWLCTSESIPKATVCLTNIINCDVIKL